jgi:hypothetical protein
LPIPAESSASDIPIFCRWYPALAG